MSDIELKPCPFCGGEAVVHTDYDTEWIECTQCHCSTAKQAGDYYDEGFMDGTYVIPICMEHPQADGTDCGAVGRNGKY